MAAMFRMPEPLAGIFTLEGIDTNSIGLDVRADDFLSSLPLESCLVRGPQTTADYLAKVKSISRS